MHFKQDKDGYLGTGHNRHLYLVDVDTKAIQPLTNAPEFNEDLPAWSPDSRRIAFVQSREKEMDADGMTDIELIDVPTSAGPAADTTQPTAGSPTHRQCGPGHRCGLPTSTAGAPATSNRLHPQPPIPRRRYRRRIPNHQQPGHRQSPRSCQLHHQGAKAPAHSPRHHPTTHPTKLLRIYAPNQQKLTWSPDGNTLAFLQGVEPKYGQYGQDRLAIINVAGGATPQVLTDTLDRAVTSYVFNKDSTKSPPQ